MLQPRRIISYCCSVASFVCVIYLIISVDLYSSENYLKPQENYLKPQENSFGLRRPKPKSNFLSEIKVPSNYIFQETPISVTDDVSTKENEKVKDNETNGFVIKLREHQIK